MLVSTGSRNVTSIGGGGGGGGAGGAGGAGGTETRPLTIPGRLLLFRRRGSFTL